MSVGGSTLSHPRKTTDDRGHLGGDAGFCSVLGTDFLNITYDCLLKTEINASDSVCQAQFCVNIVFRSRI
ncbi:hypothetical protein J6590_000310, partial [Homalodisca vitripennis]